jgi:nucleoside 2-deoxyribosyltransferase
MQMYKFLHTKADEIDRMKVAAIIFERRTMEPDNPDVHNDFVRMFLAPGDDRKEHKGHDFNLPPYPFRWDELLRYFPRTVADRFDRCLLVLGKMSLRPGRPIEVDSYVGKMRRATFSEDPLAMDFAIQSLEADGFVKTTRPKGGSVTAEITLQAKAWARIAELEQERGRHGSRQGFVAIRFTGDQAEKDIKAAMTKGIEAGGFKAQIVDAIEHNEKICDRIVAEIRKSRFLVADFTGHRQNVYYEAGFAQGLGLPVIWTCQEDEMAKDKVHFDTRQYNHIVWKTPEELAERLAQRIQATIV